MTELLPYYPEEQHIASLIDRYAVPAGDFIPSLFSNGESIVLLGEDHGESAFHGFVRDQLPTLASIGVARLCLEIDVRLKRYVHADMDPWTLARILVDQEEEHWDLSALNQAELPVRGRFLGEFFQIIEKAMRYGITPVPMHPENTSMMQCDKTMASWCNSPEKTFAYAGRLHINGIADFLLSNHGRTSYRVRPFFASHMNEDAQLFSRTGISNRIHAILSQTTTYLEYGCIGFDVRNNSDLLRDLNAIIPSKDFLKYADGVIYF